MATEVENLEAALVNVRQQIKDHTAAALKPSYGIDGQAVQWTAHYEALVRIEEGLVKALIRAQGPFERHVSVWT